MLAENTGNTMIAGRLAGDDPEGKVGFAFDPEIVTLAPGEHAVVDMRARARRRFTGSPTVRMLGLYLDEAPPEMFFNDPDSEVKGPRGEQAAIANATFIQKSVLTRGALSLLGLLVAVTVFALVITMALGRLVGQTTADRDLALQVAAARNGGGATGTSGLAGTVKLLGASTPLGAVSVSVFDASDTTKPLVTTATTGTGTYQISQLAAGKYKLSFKRAGYVTLWYPAATSDADASTVVVKTGEQKHGLDVALGGIPASISGTVLGDDVSASTVYLETIPGTTGSGTQTNGLRTTQLPTTDPATTATSPAPNPLTSGAAIVQKVPVGADGTFSLTNVPSPNVYELVVIKTGYATSTLQLNVAGGEARTGVELTLRKGDGTVTGTVSDPGGPIGGATITATSGQTTLTTVSLTDAAKKGSFTLRGLPTPGSFTLTATLANHAAQTLSLTLASGQKLTGVQINLSTSSGSLDGIVTELPSGNAAPAVTVTATNGLLTVQSETQSDGKHIGHWHIGGLPLPGTYTLTFARSDLTAQTVSVSLDANGNIPPGSNATNVDSSGRVFVSMQPATTSLSGIVRQSCGHLTTCTVQPIPEATVTLNSGSTTYTVTTAGTPESQRGDYLLENLPPGTYTLTVSVGSGVSPVSRVVNLVAGTPKVANIKVSMPAGVDGTLLANGDSASPLTGWSVFLYTAQQYPSVITRTVQTDSTGSFAFPGIDAGQYLIAVGPTTDPTGTVKTVQFTVSPSVTKHLNAISVKQ